MKLASLLLLSLPAWSTQLMSGGAGSNGVWVNFDTQLEPGSPPITKHGGGTLTERNVIKRHLCNFDNNTYFGYDLTMEPLAGGRVRLRFSPLTITPQLMTKLFDKVPQWTPLPLPGGAVTMEAKVGDTVALDLFTNPSTGQKVTDYLTIKNAQPVATVDGQARDFGPEDATLQFSSPLISADGKEVASTKGSIAGPTVWIDLPGHGRFVFSLAPRTDLGLQRAGEIRGNVVTWRSNGHDYKVVTDTAVTTGARAYNLYMIHLPRQVNQFNISAGARLDDPLRGK